jgi:hypothetical protein
VEERPLHSWFGLVVERRILIAVARMLAVFSSSWELSVLTRRSFLGGVSDPEASLSVCVRCLSELDSELVQPSVRMRDGVFAGAMESRRPLLAPVKSMVAMSCALNSAARLLLTLLIMRSTTVDRVICLTSTARMLGRTRTPLSPSSASPPSQSAPPTAQACGRLCAA